MAYRDREGEPGGCLRVIGAAIALPIAIAGLVGRCTADGSGRGNEFDVTAVIVDIDGTTIDARVTAIDEVHGEAEEIIVLGDEIRFHEGYRDGNCQRHEIGRVEDRDGESIDASELRIGGHIAIEGAVRDDVDHCEKKYPDFDNRNVYAVIQEVPA